MAASLLTAASTFVRFKVLDNLMLSSLSADIPPPGAYPPYPLPCSTLSYVYFRRFLSACNLEAVCALLEDSLQYRRIRHPSSRSKWARAIVCSVEAERLASPILIALTEVSAGSSPAAHKWSAIRVLLGHSPSPASGGWAGGSSGGGGGGSHYPRAPAPPPPLLLPPAAGQPV